MNTLQYEVMYDTGGGWHTEEPDSLAVNYNLCHTTISGLLLLILKSGHFTDCTIILRQLFL